MWPDSGSVEGGTTITVSTSVDLSNYREDDVQVFVGGEIHQLSYCVDFRVSSGI